MGLILDHTGGVNERMAAVNFSQIRKVRKVCESWRSLRLCENLLFGCELGLRLGIILAWKNVSQRV
jgi:hypothetical protein